jgi:hypothetical protein
MPDSALFWRRSKAQLNRVRPIGTYVTVVPPVYVNVLPLGAGALRGRFFRNRFFCARSCRSWFFQRPRGNRRRHPRKGRSRAHSERSPASCRVRDTALQVSGNRCVQNGDGDIFPG